MANKICVWAFPNGSHTVAGGVKINGKLYMKPNDPGIMKKFLPGNK